MLNYQIKASPPQHTYTPYMISLQLSSLTVWMRKWGWTQRKFRGGLAMRSDLLHTQCVCVIIALRLINSNQRNLSPVCNLIGLSQFQPNELLHKHIISFYAFIYVHSYNKIRPCNTDALLGRIEDLHTQIHLYPYTCKPRYTQMCNNSVPSHPQSFLSRAGDSSFVTSFWSEQQWPSLAT